MCSQYFLSRKSHLRSQELSLQWEPKSIWDLHQKRMISTKSETHRFRLQSIDSGEYF